MWNNKDRQNFFNPTLIYLFRYLTIPVYVVDDILVIFLFVVFRTDFIHCSVVSTVIELTCSNLVHSNKVVSDQTRIN